MRNTLISFAVFALLLTGACRHDTTSSSNAARTNTQVAAAHPTPDQLGVIGAQIRANPNDAGRILAQHGLTEQQFEQAVRKVSESPDAAKQYAAAFRKAEGR